MNSEEYADSLNDYWHGVNKGIREILRDIQKSNPVSRVRKEKILEAEITKLADGEEEA